MTQCPRCGGEGALDLKNSSYWGDCTCSPLMQVEPHGQWLSLSCAGWDNHDEFERLRHHMEWLKADARHAVLVFRRHGEILLGGEW